jgi:signal transduction histidine kinase
MHSRCRRHRSSLPLRRVFGWLLLCSVLVPTVAAAVDDTVVTAAAEGERARTRVRIDQLNRTAEDLARSDPSRAERLAADALVGARDSGDERGRVEALHNLGRIARLRGQLQAAHGYLLEALAAAETLGDSRLIAKVGNSYGTVLERQGLDAEALDRHQHVQNLWRELDDIPGLIASSINIARVFERRQTWNDAQRHFEAALSQYDSFPDKARVPTQDVAAIWLGLGRIALARGLIDQAEYAFTRALDLQTEHRDVVGESAARTGLARVAAARGDEAVAVAGLEQALSLATRVGARAEMVDALAELGRWHYSRAADELSGSRRRDRLQRGLDFTQRALQLGRQGESVRSRQIDLHLQLANIHELLGDAAQALTDLKTAHELRERQFQEQSDARYALLANAANMRERERELLSLRAASERQREILAQETLLKRTLAVAVILLAGIVVLVTMRFVESRRAARERNDANTRLAAALQTAELARTRAEEADRVKTEMLGIAAHDLRNPLGSIIGFAEMIRSERESVDNARRHAQIIVAAAERTLKLVGDLLDSAVLDAGQIHLQAVPCDLSVLLADVIGRIAARAQAKQQQIDFRATSGALVLADAERLDQVFENLLTNAVKFSPCKGLIEVWIELDAERARVAIRDYGPGLSDDDRRQLFKRFQRLSARPTGGESSTGLGLAIVKDLVELHGGNVRADSEGIGRGATFVVELPRLQHTPLRMAPAANETDAADQRAG